MINALTVILKISIEGETVIYIQMRKTISRQTLRMQVALAVFFFTTTSVVCAHDVTVSPKTGSMIPVLNEGYDETGWASGAFATWRHNQLPLTVSVSDNPDLSLDGALQSHANNLYPNTSVSHNDDTSGASYLVMLAGQDKPGYITFSIPRGMRFTRYRIVLKNNVTRAGTLRTGTSSNVAFRECRVSDGTWTAINTAGTYANMGATKASNTREYIVERTSTNDYDMGNTLYFTLDDGNSHTYQSVAFKSITLEFTSEAPFTVSAEPDESHAEGVSYVSVPFYTGKQDLGYIEARTSDGTTRDGYHYRQVKDTPASLLFYEQAAIGSDGNFPTTDIGEKTISRTEFDGQQYFLLSPTATQNTYFVEPPDKTSDQYGNNIYVKYRITGATIHYAKNVDAAPICYITYKDDKGNINFLQADGRSWSTSKKAVWNNDDGILSTVVNGTTYYLAASHYDDWFNTTYYLDLSEYPEDATLFDIQNGRISFSRYSFFSGWITYNLTTSLFNRQYLSFAPSSTRSRYTYPAYTDTHGHETTDKNDAQTLDNYAITVYGTDANTPIDTINVSEAGSYDINNLNNDAVKFSISGKAMVYVEVRMESLNPFTNSMDVTMTSKDHPSFSVSQTFTATDFAVGGGTFNFAIPSDLAGSKVDFNFTNLRSNYADETYPWGNSEHHSRYNFVKSKYFNLHNVGGATSGDEATTFAGDNNLYNSKADVANHTYEDKVSVGTIGNVPFKYNNASTYEDEINKSANGQTTLKEYMFTLENYANQKSLSGASENGNFTPATITTTPDSTSAVNAYVFTTDETRYNIAPTKNVQHRMQAFYNMTINANTTTYETTANLNQVYNSSYYGDAKTGKFYGATVSTTQGSSGQSSVEQAIAKIKAACDAAKVGYSQILYIDMGSQLSGVYTASDNDWADIKATFTAPNLLVFLPKNTTHVENNFAYAEDGAQELTFKASNNIVITDMQPFYSPYDISMDATKYALYERRATSNKNGKVEWATVVLPFVIKDLYDGIKADGNGNEIAVLKMNAANAINNVNRDVPTAFFSLVTDGQTVANMPYAIHVEKNSSDDNNISFILQQYGSNIVKTPIEAGNNGVSDVLIHSAETSTGTLADGTNVSFTMSGTYAGAQIDKTTHPIFYFAKDGFYCSANLASAYRTANLRPFRAFYDFTTNGNAQLAKFTMAIGENNDPTSIDDLPRTKTGITTGSGTITISAATNKYYSVNSVAGINYANFSLRTGEERTIHVPAGLYIVNGVKVIVR